MTIAHEHYSDLPTTHDELGFAPDVAALLEIITGVELIDTPLTIGVYGAWGSGKTSFMRMLLAQLQPETIVPLWFEAWHYAQSDVLWRALLLNVVEGLRTYLVQDEAQLQAIMRSEGKAINEEPDAAAVQGVKDTIEQELDDLIASLYRNVEREEAGALELDWSEAGKLATRLIVRTGFGFIPGLTSLTKLVEAAQGKIGEGEDIAGIWDLFHRQRTKIYRDQVCALDQFQTKLRELIERWITSRGRRLVMFIDDLDRCLPEQAVGVLEAIKVFLDIPGCIFVLGMDREVIEHGIRVRYKEFALNAATAAREGKQAAVFPIAGRDYLEKIIQVPFELPPLAEAGIEHFLRERIQRVPGIDEREAGRIAAVMTAGLQRNPRKVKRTFNLFRLRLARNKAYQRAAAPPLLAKLVVIQSSYPSVYESIVERPRRLCELDKQARGIGSVDDQQVKDALLNNPLLKAMLYRDPFFDQLTDEQLHELIFQP